jgi:hypothetical protein
VKSVLSKPQAVIFDAYGTLRGLLAGYRNGLALCRPLSIDTTEIPCVSSNLWDAG